VFMYGESESQRECVYVWIDKVARIHAHTLNAIDHTHTYICPQSTHEAGHDLAIHIPLLSDSLTQHKHTDTQDTHIRTITII